MKKGFTLIELSIVLVVIGLIVSGVLVGRDLIKAAERRKFIAEWEKIQTEVMTFRSKYDALPGDMTNAEAIWGRSSGGCPDGSRTGTETCSGNGDGHIGVSTADPTESFNFWQHLQNAGLTDGKFTGRTSSPDLAYPGINIPESKVYSKVGYVFRFAMGNCLLDQGLGLCDQQGQNYANVGTASANCGFTGWYTWCPHLTITEAMQIDMKVDDGKSATGKWMANGSAFNPSCTTSDVIATSVWNTAGDDGAKRCSFNIVAAW